MISNTVSLSTTKPTIDVSREELSPSTLQNIRRIAAMAVEGAVAQTNQYQYMSNMININNQLQYMSYIINNQIQMKLEAEKKAGLERQRNKRAAKRNAPPGSELNMKWEAEKKAKREAANNRTAAMRKAPPGSELNIKLEAQRSRDRNRDAAMRAAPPGSDLNIKLEAKKKAKHNSYVAKKNTYFRLLRERNSALSGESQVEPSNDQREDAFRSLLRERLSALQGNVLQSNLANHFQDAASSSSERPSQAALAESRSEEHELPLDSNQNSHVTSESPINLREEANDGDPANIPLSYLDILGDPLENILAGSEEFPDFDL